MRLTRSTVLDVLRQDYVRTAHAKGLRERKVVTRHVLRNAILPVITVIGLQVPLLVGGTVILERIFSIPGMASYLLSSIQQRDYPVVQAVVLISATVVVVSNLLVDMTYALIDPRIRLS
jgi:peptide/nickel transport system permease protein